VKGKRIK